MDAVVVDDVDEEENCGCDLISKDGSNVICELVIIFLFIYCTRNILTSFAYNTQYIDTSRSFQSMVYSWCKGIYVYGCRGIPD